MVLLTPRPAFLSRHTAIAAAAVAGISLYLVLRFIVGTPAPAVNMALYAVLVAGGIPLVMELALSTARGQFGADLLAGVSIVTAVLLGEYLAGAVVVLMLSSGEAMEAYAVGRASSVLSALARRIPSVAHRLTGRQTEDITLDAIAIGDRLVVYPHEVCPVDGVVVEGRGIMDESYLTGEPFMMSKAPGSTVFSGAINGEGALTLRATRLAVDSRYARIMAVMRDSEQRRPRLRRLGDQLGALYTPAAVSIAVAAWAWSGDPIRFLAVLVVATPCPLLIAIPVAIIGSISLAAERSIIVRDPAVLEQLGQCRTIVLDKTGTLTYGRPVLTEQMVAPGLDEMEILQLAATVERYSKHPLAAPLLDAARQARLRLPEVNQISERPGEGIEGTIDPHHVQILGRRQAEARGLSAELPPVVSGLECVVLVDGRYAATYRFRDQAREDGRPFISHLQPQHRIDRILLVSGDRDEEVQYLAELVG
ncbi:MAG: HAD-IC family P-type ATPase, partial [Gemmatimonadetes bacterium]|nr:HAD-IC family P-type ATPase [Gemmatimonadota bacterium]